MSKFRVFHSMEETDNFESEEEVNKELEMMYLATDGDFVVLKDGNFYCKGSLDKEYNYNIKQLHDASHTKGEKE